MPRKLKIVNGPPFRGFVVNAVLTEVPWDAIFTMNKRIPVDHISIIENPAGFQVRVEMLGRGRSGDEFRFVARANGRCEIWFYVGFYDTCTRKGECLEMTANEFARSDMNRYLFPGLVQ